MSIGMPNKQTYSINKLLGRVSQQVVGNATSLMEFESDFEFQSKEFGHQNDFSIEGELVGRKRSKI
jgi:hypothetical protein